MRVVVQRVLEASSTVDEKVTGSIDNGYLLLVAIAKEDTEIDIQKMAKKIINLRIFNDEFGKMNRSIKEVNGSILSISQFTLYGDASHGNRPSFTNSAPFQEAEKMYLEFNQELKNYKVAVECGVFGADMKIRLLNDGPVTIILNSCDL